MKQRSAVKYFTGYVSASRTLLVYDPELDRYFYLKPGTNYLNGAPVYKDLPFKKAEFAVAVSEALAQREKEISDPIHIHLIHETAAYGFTFAEEIEPGVFEENKNIEPGVIVREVPKLEKGEVLVNVFSLLDADLGKQIAADNGSENPVSFWEKHLLKSLALAMAEFSINYRAHLLSPHGQNLFLKMYQEGGRLIPTDHFYLQDDLDIDLEKVWRNTEYFKNGNQSTQNDLRRATSMRDIGFSTIIKDSYKNGHLPVRFQPLGYGRPHKNAPDWLTSKDYERWGEIFFDEFYEHMKRLGGGAVRLVGKIRKVRARDQSNFIKEVIGVFDLRSLNDDFKVRSVNYCDLF